MLPAIAAVRPAVYEIIVVDGNSSDGTVEVARRVLPGVKAISQTRKGKGNALACGFAAATGDIIVMFDADGSADPAEIPAFVDALVAGADFAKGTRFAPGGGSDDITPAARLGNRASTASSTRCSARATPTSATATTPSGPTPPGARPPPSTRPRGGMLWGDGFEIETLLNCRMAAAGLRITEVPCVERAAHATARPTCGPSRDGARVLRTILRERRATGVEPARPLAPEELT